MKQIQLTYNVSFDKLIHELSLEELHELRDMINEKLQNSVVDTRPVENILLSDVASDRILRVLYPLEVKYVGDLKKYSQQYISKLRGVGPDRLKEILEFRTKYDV